MEAIGLLEIEEVEMPEVLEDVGNLSDADLLTKRNRAITASREVLSRANAEGRLVTAEERQAMARSQNEAALCVSEQEARASGGGRGAEDAADQTVMDGQRSKFTHSGNRFTALPEAKRGSINAQTHMRFLRGDKAAYGGNAIAFTRPDTRALETGKQVVYRADDDTRTELRALSSGDASAGATIASPFIQKLYDAKETYSTFRALMPTRLTTATGSPTRWPVVSAHGKAGNSSGDLVDAPLAEFASIGGTDATFDDITFNAYKVGQILPLSNEIRTDNAVDLEAWVLKELQRNAARQEDRWFILGNSTNMPQGVVNGGFANATEEADHEALSFEDIATVTAALDQSYGALRVHTPQAADTMTRPDELAWFMHKSVLLQVWLVTDGDSRFIFQEQLSKGVYDTLMGFRIVTSPFLPVMAADTTVAYFGSWSDAIIMREAGPTQLVWSDHSSFAEDARDYKITCRVDSKVRDDSADVGLKTAA